jgi:hypothetical protein
LSTNGSLSGVVLALVGGGDADEWGDADEPDEPDKCEEARECAGECGGESITLARSAAYSLIRALRVCRPCARAVRRESGETLRICVKRKPMLVVVSSQVIMGRGREKGEQTKPRLTHLVRTPLMAPPPGGTDEAIGTGPAVEPAAGGMRVDPEDELDVLAGALDVDAAVLADDLDTA